MKLVTSVILVFILLFSISLKAQQALNTGNTTIGIRKTFASEQITVAATAIGFTAATINPSGGAAGNLRATVAVCTNNQAEIRILSSGTNPTTTLGLVIPIGGSFVIYGYDDISSMRAIRTGGTSGILDCQYSRLP